MRYEGFIGPSNPSQSPIADGERSVNFYVEPIQSQFAPSGNALYPTPARTTLITVPDVGTRALFEMNARTFSVIGGGFYELFLATNTYTRWGNVAQDNNPATISYNGISGGQLGITAGTNWYNFQLATNVLTQVAAMNGKATQGGMKDAYFLCFSVTESKVYVSALNDGTTWNTGVSYFQRSIAPDPWVAMIVGNPQIWMIGEQTSEAWYNAGTNSQQPFAPILSSFMQSGSPASFSATLVDDTLVWLQQTGKGSAKIVAARGYFPRAISNYAVETALSGYLRTSIISDCEVLGYQQEGHLWACFNFPMARATWCVDMDTGAWHERGDWDAPNNRYNVWGPRVHGFSTGKNLVGDRATGIISYLDVTGGTDNATGIIRRMRIGPPLWASARQRLQVGLFSLIMDTGLGTLAGQGVNPVAMLSTTEDGRIFGAERQCSVGRMGQYNRRVFWTRAGSSRKLWAPKIVVTDPIPWRISGAEIEGAGFSQARAA